MNKVRIVFLTFGLFVCSPAVFGQDLLSLPQAIEFALENNYDVRISKKTEKVAETNVTRGNAGFLPTVGASTTKNYSRNNTYQERVIGDSIAIREANGVKSESFNIGANVNWTVFDGLGMFYTFERLDAQKDVSSYQLKVTMENMIAELTSAYYTVAVEQERVDVLENSIQLSERRLEIAKNKYELGKASKVEYLAAQVDYNADRTALMNEEQLLYRSKVDLNQVMARETSIDFVVDSVINIDQELEMSMLIESANAQNPTLLQLQRQLNVAYLQIQEVKSARYPVVSLFGGYSKSTNISPLSFAPFQKNAGLNYGLTATLNIFNGFNTERQIQVAKIQMETSELNISKQKLSLEADINRNFYNYQTSKELIEIERQNLAVAKENENIALERYQLGNSTPLELREAQINAVQAESRLINAAFSTKLAEIELLRLSGSLVTTFSE
ncbi:TolC family protein [Imperialibacter roseus]|uniref:TolC family protein n=1 Tax=Imperialibacter roseus TaxID=1324217 RepID=A0ABZ0INA1_9BACT|nr:TolC family protein [Imperialibacter roseus]WOK05810.1 TolC family protein [Imperialibacter roseus]